MRWGVVVFLFSFVSFFFVSKNLYVIYIYIKGLCSDMRRMKISVRYKRTVLICRNESE